MGQILVVNAGLQELIVNLGFAIQALLAEATHRDAQRRRP
jgi:hypothetical protein